MSKDVKVKCACGRKHRFYLGKDKKLKHEVDESGVKPKETPSSDGGSSTEDTPKGRNSVLFDFVTGTGSCASDLEEETSTEDDEDDNGNGSEENEDDENEED